MAREWQEQAKRLRPGIRGGRGGEALERHVETVTMRANSLVTTEADFFQTLIEHQVGIHTGSQHIVRPTVSLPLYTGLTASTHCRCASADW